MNIWNRTLNIFVPISFQSIFFIFSIISSLFCLPQSSGVSNLTHSLFIHFRCNLSFSQTVLPCTLSISISLTILPFSLLLLPVYHSMSLSNQEKKKERNDSLSNNTIIINIMIVRQIYHSIEMNPKNTFTRIEKGRELHQENGEKWNEIEWIDR